MTTLFLSHSSYLDHDTGPGHPENSDRIRVITETLERERLANLVRADAPGIDRAAILRVHPAHYVDAIEAATPARGSVHLDPDTVMSAQSFDAIGHCVGAATAAVDEVMRGGAKNAFVAMRPPGHHAGIASPMGFCFFNNAAIAARHAQAAHGAERVAIVDFDVHHGNGTQEIFWSDCSVLYASTHQMPLFPGTGARDERGEHDNIVNAPLRAGDNGEIFREAMETTLVPRIKAFRPDLIVISAGFDAHRLDPIGGLNLVEADFAWATEQLMEIAGRHAKGRIVSILEGGYHLEGLARSVAAHVAALMSV
ncbi:MAG: histone deacetylase family protein [Pseudomonadota bacterium]|nr:histone deacetylase family protein [Pseudomonadota bacterium]